MANMAIIGGNGRMGRALAAAIPAAGHELAGAAGRGDDVGALAAAAAVLIDFSAADALEANLDAATAYGRAVLVGTTGLTDRHHWLIDAAAAEVPVLQTGNTSLGITLLTALVRQAAAALGPDWDIEIIDIHHRAKVDAPSGTALMLGAAAAAGRGVDLAASTVPARTGITGPRPVGGIGFAALRGGTAAGEHQLLFAGPDEQISLTHRAENRGIFARGAVRAAAWLIGQPAGRYTMADVLKLAP